MSKSITKALGSILVVLGLIGTYDSWFHGKDDSLLPQVIGDHVLVTFVWPLLLVAGALLLFLTITKTKRAVSHKKILTAGLIMLGLPIGFGIVFGTGEAGGMLVTILAIYVGVPGLFLTASALVLMRFAK
jgi:hypothetical protein